MNPVLIVDLLINTDLESLNSDLLLLALTFYLLLLRILTCSLYLLWSYWTRAGMSFMGARVSLRLIQRATVSLGMYCISKGENL